MALIWVKMSMTVSVGLGIEDLLLDGGCELAGVPEIPAAASLTASQKKS
jgi:hypothetical protein